ncbi:MAG TPA: phosphatase PAP2 family protein [Candidatus Dormibacteraeota bacterium]|jgi:membrane-associated phospholipid phosphatase|nr:phosphatase PAP2 family protein [Candidatus Dormibacteraeota bacterium]
METNSATHARLIRRRDLLRLGLAGTALGVGGTLLVDRPIRVQADPSSQAADDCRQVEPTAGNWKTWVLTSGSEIPVPPPPGVSGTRREIETLESLVSQRSAAARDRIKFWDAGAVYRWAQLATERIGQGTATSDSAGHPVSGLVSARPHALAMVAIYDAVIAAWNWKYRYHRRRPSEFDHRLTTVIPNPASPSYPSEHAVVAGAAVAVLSYLYPSEKTNWEALADEAGQTRVLAGVEYPSDVAAGRALGQAVGQKMIDRRATKDNFPGEFAVTIPTVDPTGLYGSTEPMWNATNPVFPSAGSWKTWVISSAAAFRPKPYPSVFSPEGKADQFGADPANGLKGVLNWDRTLDQTHGANLAHNFEALFAQSPPGMLIGEGNDVQKRIQEERLEDNPPRTARAHALSAIAKHDALVACFAAKYFYWRIRPYQLAKLPTITAPGFYTLFPTPNHPSYPAAHGAGSGSTNAIAAYLFPRDATTFTQEANDLGESRLWAGIHYQTDIDAGLDQGRKIAAEVIKVANADGSHSVGAAASVEDCQDS